MTDAPAPADGFGMTDLEEALNGPDAAAVRVAATARLDALAGRVAAELGRGASPDRFARLSALRRAVAVAARAVPPSGPAVEPSP